MAKSSDSVTAVRPVWKAGPNNDVVDAVDVTDADASNWPPLSQPSPSKVCESKKKGIRGLSPQSQSQQLLSFPPHMHYSSPRTAPNQYHGFMPAPPPPPLPPNYMPPTCFPLPFDALTYVYVPTLPPASSFVVPAPVLYPPPLELKQKIIQQINYYFCEDNLAKDVFLRSKMDDKGWVSVHTIASFRKVSQLTKSSQVIMDSMRSSNSVEVGNWKLRKRANWTKWLLGTSSKDTSKDASPKDTSPKELNR